MTTPVGAQQGSTCWCGGQTRRDEDGLWCLEDVNHEPMLRVNPAHRQGGNGHEHLCLRCGGPWPCPQAAQQASFAPPPAQAQQAFDDAIPDWIDHDKAVLRASIPWWSGWLSGAYNLDSTEADRLAQESIEDYLSDCDPSS